MFSIFHRSAGLTMAAAMLVFAPMVPPQAAAAENAEECMAVGPGRCSFTPGREGVHRIELTLASAQTSKLRDLNIGGQQCPLLRQKTDSQDDVLHVACFAYLSGGVTYELSAPDSSRVSIVKADPTHGEPVTVIP